MEQTPNTDPIAALPPRFKTRARYSVALHGARLPGGPVADFATHVADVATGVERVMRMLEQDFDTMRDQRDELTAGRPVDPDTRTLFNPFDRNVLERLAGASLVMLGSAAEDLLAWAYDTHTEEGRQSALKRAQMIADRVKGGDGC